MSSPRRPIIALAVTLVAGLLLGLLSSAWVAGASTGGSDTTFVPITPCRLMDTRPAPDRVGSAARFGPADTKTVQATGSNGDCVVPNDAVAVTLNATAVGASRLSFFTFWPDGDMPLASSLNPSPGAPPIPNAVTTELSPGGSFNVFNAVGSVDLVIDVTGYHVRQTLIDIDTEVEALQAELDALRNDVAALAASAPFVESATTAEVVISGTTFAPTELLAIPMVAPSDGTIVLTASIRASNTDAGVRAICAISDDGTVPVEHLREFQATVNTHSGELTMVRELDVDAGESLLVTLECTRLEFLLTNSSTTFFDPQLIAVFIPDR